MENNTNETVKEYTENFISQLKNLEDLSEYDINIDIVPKKVHRETISIRKNYPFRILKTADGFSYDYRG